MSRFTINNVLELLRWAGAATGIFFAYHLDGNASSRLDILCLWVVVAIAGLTGIESLFFGSSASSQLGYIGGREYQRQSGLFNLALALTTILIYILKWDLQAKASLLIVLLFFLFFSAMNHAYSTIFEGNRSLKNALRPLMTLALLAVVISLILQAF